MKRLLALIMAFAFVLSLTGCVPSPDGSQGGGRGEPTPTPRQYFPNPFTGEEKAADFPEGQRAVAIMINNISVSRPHRGLSQASILFESKVEGGITRFMGIFEDYTTLEDVGPVRSARDQFFQWTLPWQPLYCHIGRSGITQTYIDTFDYNDLDLNGYVTQFTYQRSRPGYDTEHTSYTNGQLLQEVVAKKGYDMEKTYTEPVFNFVPYDNGNDGFRELNGESATEVSIVHSASYRTYFDYDAANRRYLMSMYNSSKKTREAAIDENNGEQLGFENVIVAFADITTYPYPGGNLDKNGNDKGDPGYQKVDLSYGGIGYYFSNGKMEQIRWFKGGASDPLRFTDMDENPLELNCGKTYIGFVDLDEYDNFDYAGPGDEIVETIDPNAGGNEVEVEVE